jgi:hypothetical protein
MCLRHLSQAKGEEYDLYRIFYCDCVPYEKKQYNPVTNKSIDFSNKGSASWPYTLIIIRETVEKFGKELPDWIKIKSVTDTKKYQKFSGTQFDL